MERNYKEFNRKIDAHDRLISSVFHARIGIYLAIDKIIFNDPAATTVIIWSDGTKTVVKCYEKDIYSREAGMAMCVSKKIFGDNFHKFLKLAEEPNE